MVPALTPARRRSERKSLRRILLGFPARLLILLIVNTGRVRANISRALADAIDTDSGFWFSIVVGLATVGIVGSSLFSLPKHLLSSVHRLFAARLPAYHTMVFNAMALVVKRYFDEHPVHSEDYMNTGKTSLSGLTWDGWLDICSDIAVAACDDDFFTKSLEAINNLARFDYPPHEVPPVHEDGTYPENDQENFTVHEVVGLRDLMMKHRSTSPRRTDTLFTHWMTKSLKNRRTEIPILAAALNEIADVGMFRFNQDVIAVGSMKQSIIDLIRRDCQEEEDVMTEAEAAGIVVSVLMQYDLQYLYHFDIEQLTALALHHIWYGDHNRKSSIQRLINDHKRRTVRNQYTLNNLTSAQVFELLHIQERNELTTMLDYMIKTKANIHQLIRLLTVGQAIHLNLYDPDRQELTTDIYVLVPNQVTYEICQGTARQHFGDYQAYNGHERTYDQGRFMVGLCGARVIDAMAPHVNETRNGAFVGGRGVHLDGIRFIREVSYSKHYSSRNGMFECFEMHLSGNTVKLHRLVGMMLSHYDATVFSEGVLGSIDINNVGNYDHRFVYQPLDDVARDSIERALRHGNVVSNQCDWDHRCGTDLRYLNGALFGAPTSHRMNICFIFVRRNAGHWLFGLIHQRYIGGVESSERNPLAILAPFISGFPTVDDVARGDTYRPTVFDVRLRNPLEILPERSHLHNL